MKQGSGASLFDAQRDDAGVADGPRTEVLAAAVMRRAHFEKLRLCEVLEEIADSLPGRVDRLKCLGVANMLVPLLREIHRYEEDTIFPAYEAVHGDTEASTTRRLRAEHVEDECFADEVTEVLLAIGHGRTVANAEALGFMLRGLFETIRRHIAFEREHILPMIGLVERQ